MSKKIREVIQAFKKLLLQEFGDRVLQVVLFGSCATGRDNPLSDIDIAVILDCPVDWHTKEKVYDLAFEAESDSGRLLNVSVFYRQEYENRSIESLLLIDAINEQGIPV